MTNNGNAFRNRTNVPLITAAGAVGKRTQAVDGKELRSDIQALRALAVLFVVLFHAGAPYLTGGYIGVDIFFVISGYLITKLLVSEYDAKGRIDFTAFYARRIRRLLPAATLVLTVTAVAMTALLSPIEQRDLAKSFLFSALYASNIWFGFRSTDYLAANTHEDPFLHTWSLSVEEQFYLAWPLLMLVLLRASRRAGGPTGFLCSTGLLLAASFAASLLVGSVSQPWAFFGSPLRAWEFAIGAVVFASERAGLALASRFGPALTSAGLLAVFAAAVMFDRTTPFPGWYAAVPTVGTALILVGAARTPWFCRVSAWRPALWLGNTSYSLYLWHWPLIAIPQALYGNLPPAARAACVLAALLFSGLSYRHVEQRFRFAPFFHRAPRWALLIGCALTAVSGSVALTMWAVAKHTLASPDQLAVLEAQQDLPRIYADGCHQKYSQVEVGNCVYGDTSSKKTIVLFGDSHAAQWFPAIDRFAHQSGFRLISLTKSACPSVLITPWNGVLQRPYEECSRWQQAAIARILSERPALVVISNARSYAPTTGSVEDFTDNWYRGLSATLAELASAQIAAIVVRDSPKFPVDVPTCLSRAAWTGQSVHTCDAPRGNALNERISAAEKSATVRYARASFVDVSNALCDAQECFSTIAGKVAYRDAHHLTAPAVLATSSHLEDAIRQALAKPNG